MDTTRSPSKTATTLFELVLVMLLVLGMFALSYWMTQ
jgi:hypothetical protein